MDVSSPYQSPQTDINAQGDGTPLPLADLGARFGARMLDGLIQGLPLIIGLVLTQMTAGADGPNPVFILLGFAAFVGLFIVQTIRLVRTGQTLGKKWMSVRVVDMHGQLVGIGPHFLRGLIFGFLGFVDALFGLRVDRRTLHDLAAGTQVVRVRNH